MNIRTKNIVHVSVIIVVVAVVMVIARQGFAWTNPAGAPPFSLPSISTSGGNVGIGTSAPVSKLTVKVVEGDSNGLVNGLNVLGDTNGKAVVIGANSTYGWIQSHGSVPLYINELGNNIILNKNAGVVGIGTVSPDSNYKLTTIGGGVKADNSSASQPAGYFNNMGGGPALTVGMGGLTLGGVNQTSWPSGTWTTSGTNIYNANSGNVGIGTASPATKLDVSSGVISAQSSGVSIGSGSGYGCTGCGSNTTLTLYDPTSGSVIFNTGYATSYYDFQRGGVSKVRIDANGNVGIGTTAPAVSLHVNGSVRGNQSGALRIDSGNGYIDVGAQNASFAHLQTDRPQFYFNKQVSVDGSLKNYADAYSLTQSGSSYINGGNLGIGTTAPAYKLDVVGTIRSQGDFLADANYGLGLVGLYDPTRYRNVYSMGSAYRLAANGTTPGNLYGIAMSYEPNYGGAGNNAQAIAGLGHQFLFMSNGVTQTAIGTGISTVGSATIAGTVTANGGSSSNWAAVNAPSFNAGVSIYSYGSICTGNSSGGCGGANGTVLGLNNTSATNNIPNSGAVFFNGGNVGIGTTAPVGKLDISTAVAGQKGIEISSDGTGVHVVSASSNGISATGGINGVYGGGITNGVSGFGNTSGVSGTGPIGVLAQGNGVGSTGVQATGDSYGIYSTGTNAGVSAGVYATGSYVGVFGRGNGGPAGSYGMGSSSGVTGVGTYGVIGYGSLTATGVGVYGYAAVGVQAYGNTSDFYATGPGIDYGTASSIRWKSNITGINNALDKILKLRGVYYDWDKEHGGKRDMGFIAEEIGTVVPEIVAWDKDAPGYATAVDYGHLTPVLVEAIKDQQKQIEELKKEIAEIKK